MQLVGSYMPTNANKKLYAQHPVDNAGSEWQDDIEGWQIITVLFLENTTRLLASLMVWTR